VGQAGDEAKADRIRQNPNVADKQKRAERIRAAKAELEAEAKAAAEAKAKAKAEAEEKGKDHKQSGEPPAPPSADPKAQKNFTDPESRIMKGKDGSVQAYNGQIAVDAQAQIIVAQDVTQCAADSPHLIPMVDGIEANLGGRPEQASADSGYCSEANLEAMEKRNIDAYVATGRAKHAATGEAATASAAGVASSAQATQAPTRVEAMRQKIKSGGYASPYRLRKQLPEPVFGQIKEARGFRQFLMRGIEKVRAEWALVCTAHNLLKLAQGRRLSAGMQG
jgi:septal ring factor EnvC (AmiA/AmiB activator)